MRVSGGEQLECDVRRDVTRFYSYLRSFSQDVTTLDLGRYPGLSSRSFHEPGRFPIVQALETAYDKIRSEVLSLDKKAYQVELEKVTRQGSWNVLQLFERGRKNDENCRLCPTTVRLIEDYSTVRTLAGLVYVSKMTPGTHITPHCGPTNIRLRCHLGIQVPKGDCGLRVADERCRWCEGKCIVFDDSLEHESWNHTTETRIVVIIDLWHADLSRDEILLLEGLHNYASAQAENLAHYWLAHAKARNVRSSGSMTSQLQF